MRKIIQISAIDNESLFILCDDGTLWDFVFGSKDKYGNDEWQFNKFPPIPQDPEDKEN